MKELLISSYCKMHYWEELGCISLRWDEYTLSSIFKNTLNSALEELKKKNLKAMLVDNRNMKVLMKKDADWLLNVWTPKALEAGFRINAVVENKDKPLNTRHSDTVLNLSENNDDVFIAKVFYDMEMAQAWLKEMVK